MGLGARIITTVLLLLGLALFALPGTSLSSYGIGRFIGAFILPLLLASAVRWVYLRSIKRSDAKVWGGGLTGSVPLLATAVLIAAAVAIPEAARTAAEQRRLEEADPADPNEFLTPLEGYQFVDFSPEVEEQVRSEILSDPAADEEIAAIEVKEVREAGRSVGFIQVTAVEPEVFATAEFEDNFVEGLQSGFGTTLERTEIDGHEVHTGSYEEVNVISFFLDEGVSILVATPEKDVGRDIASLVIAEHG